MTSKILPGHDAELAVFGPSGPMLLEVVRTVIRALDEAPVRYKWLEEAEHLELVEIDIGAAVKVQVTELLYHAHFAAVATLVRAYRWAEGCLSSYSEDLFLPFCASARGLLEATGDSYDALPRVPLSLATNHKLFRRALAGEPIALQFEEIEKILLHFSHGRRLTKAERANMPDYMPAKEAATYMKPLESFKPGGFAEWYQELCEFTHPASNSVCYMLVPNGDGKIAFHPSIDRGRLKDHIAGHQERLAEVLRLSQVPALLLLKVLLHLGPTELRLSGVKSIDMSHVSDWKKCAAALRVAP